MMCLTIHALRVCDLYIICQCVKNTCSAFFLTTGAFFVDILYLNEYNTAISTQKSLFANNYVKVVFKALQIFCLNTAAGDPWQFFGRHVSIGSMGAAIYNCDYHILYLFPPNSLESCICCSHGWPCKATNL